MVEEHSHTGLEEVFSLVANDIRLAILHTLWDRYTADPRPEPRPVPFSTLREQVDIRDPGQFHYHLDKLVPAFVRRHDDGYTLTYAGAQIVGAAVSGVYTETETTFDTTSGDSCPDPSCEGTLELGYDRGHVVADCDTCNLAHMMSAPPILVDAHDVEDAPELLGVFTTTRLLQIVRGFCHLCSGPVEASVAQSFLTEGTDSGQNVKIVHTCSECGSSSYTSATTSVLDHPAVVSLLHRADIDYRTIPPWQITQTLNAQETVHEDPVRVEVKVSVGEETLTLLLDESLEVCEHSEG